MSTPVRALISVLNSASVGGSPRVSASSRLRKIKPAVVGQRRDQAEPGRPHDDAAAFGRVAKAHLHIGGDIPTVIGLSREMFVHRIARRVMAAARGQHVRHRDDLGSPATIERHAQAGRIVFDRRHFGAEFDLEAKARQMLAQDGLGAPLRKAALKRVLAAGVGEARGSDFPQARAQRVECA